MKKRLYKSRENKVLCGICGGIGEYFDIDPVIVRVILIVLCCVGFSGVIAYIIAAFVIPERPTKAEEDLCNSYNRTYKQNATVVDAEVVHEESEEKKEENE